MLDEKSSNTASVVVLCTAPDEATAQDLAAKVLAEKLAACATLIPGATSLYYWEGSQIGGNRYWFCRRIGGAGSCRYWR